jgi:Tol biopolymer transport system component
MDFKGDDLTQITYTPDIDEVRGSWSHNGEWLAFISTSGIQPRSLFVMNSQTGNTYQLTEEVFIINYTWSSIEDTIVYSTSNDDGSGSLFQISLVSSDIKELRRIPSPATSLDWSHSGRFLAYAFLEAGDADIHLLDLETQITRKITEGITALDLTWSPSDEQLGFLSFDDLENKVNIYVLSLDNGDVFEVPDELDCQIGSIDWFDIH